MECAGATPPSDTLVRPACVLSMAVAFGRRDNPFRLDGPANNSVDAYSDCILERSDQPNADLQVLSLCGLALVPAALRLVCVSRTSTQRSTRKPAICRNTRGVSAYARPSDRRGRATAR